MGASFRTRRVRERFSAARAQGFTPWVVGAVLFVILAAGALWLIPDPLVGWTTRFGPVRRELEAGEYVVAVGAARQSVLLAVGGVLAVITLLFTKQRDVVAVLRHQLDQDANWTARYSEAIRQLGDAGTLAVRLGGIYALQRIGEDSERDRSTVLEVLAAFVRDKSPLLTDTSRAPKAPTTDVAAANQCIGRLTRLLDPEGGFILELDHVHLAVVRWEHATLSHAMLMGSQLYGARLHHATLRGTRCHGATFLGAEMQFADCRGADFTGADFRSAYLDNGDFSGAEMVGAKLANARMNGTILANANLRGADVSGTDLRLCVGITAAQQSTMKSDATTKWPAYLDI